MNLVFETALQNEPCYHLAKRGAIDMAFNYQKNKEHSQDSFWTSYSDLFLGLSTIFLLLYVTASLRTGTDALRGQIENQKLSIQVDELKHQLAMYESVKNEYLEKQADKSEVQEYQELMDKLTLLQEDAKTEKDRLIAEALENDKKVKALNKYQQMVRNVLNANKMAKAKIITRDDLIKEQDVEIETQEAQITNLEKDIDSKKQLIAQGEQRIQETELALQKRLKELQSAYKKNKITKKLYQKQMAQLQADSEKKVQQLAQTNAQYEQQLQQASAQLGEAQGALEKTRGELAAKLGENQQLQGQLQAAEGERRDLYGKLSATQNEKKNLLGQLEQTQGEVGSLKQGLAKVRGKLNVTEGELAKAKAEIEARKSVAGEIRKGFAKAGIKADIDAETGDVVLDFGQAYFDSDSDRLKKEMKGVLERAMPIYSKSLFGNPKVSDKISSVEIIGFASPTYQGRFVDPTSNNPRDKAALKYNMDLSYRRANSIFNYILDEQNMKFEHQRDLLSLMKVSGRSFLEVMQVQNRNIATAAEFCRQNDCRKTQRVIIRFSMDQKK